MFLWMKCLEGGVRHRGEALPGEGPPRAAQWLRAQGQDCIRGWEQLLGGGGTVHQKKPLKVWVMVQNLVEVMTVLPRRSSKVRREHHPCSLGAVRTRRSSDLECLQGALGHGHVHGCGSRTL